MNHDNQKTRRTTLKLLGSLTLASFSSQALSSAQDFPNRQVRIIGGLAAAGPADLATRIVAQALNQRLGQSFIAENRLGGGGAVAIQEVGRAAKDGYTLGAPTTGPLVILSKLQKQPFYQTLDIVTPISLIAAYPYAMVVRKDLPVNTVAELIDYARKNPGKLSFGSGGIGTSNHLGMEWFKKLTGINVVHVPYKGDNDIIADLVGGRIDLAMNTPAVIAGHINSGRVKALAVSSENRLSTMPNLPTMIEAGVKGFVVEAYTVIVGPAGLPQDLLVKLNQEFNAVLRLPEVREKMAQLTMYPVIHSPESIRQFIEDQQNLWGSVIRDANITLI